MLSILSIYDTYPLLEIVDITSMECDSTRLFSIKETPEEKNHLKHEQWKTYTLYWLTNCMELDARPRDDLGSSSSFLRNVRQESLDMCI